jgi:xeroderma pigmentosum group C-complementing protein
MLDEVAETTDEGRPIKRRRRTGMADSARLHAAHVELDSTGLVSESFDKPSLDYEDVLPKEVQTIYDSEGLEDSEDSDIAWEEVELGYGAEVEVGASEGDNEAPNLTLTLSTTKSGQKVPTTERRKALTNAEKRLRLEIHKMHILCLLSHIEQRNEWCNDIDVQVRRERSSPTQTLTLSRQI